MPVVTSSADGKGIPDMDFYKYESNRLLSFQCWSSDCPVRPFVLAFFGFFCPSPRETQCFACHKRVSNWTCGEDPFKRHVNMSPNCPFILHPREFNVPLKLQERNNILGRLHKSKVEASEMFKLEKNRLLSFSNTAVYNPNNFAVWYGLAADGFFGIGSNTVECFACHGQVSLNLQLKAVEVHDMMFKNCPLPSATPCGNRTIAANDLEKFKQFFNNSRSFRANKNLRHQHYHHNYSVITEKDLLGDGREEI